MGMKLTILGSGTSQGVPVIGCRCAVCTSKDPRDNRLRTSAMLEWDDIRLVIDAGPDFRYQMLRTGVRHIDAILLTHEHKDHIGGLDDVRAFNFVDYPTIHRIDVFGTRQTLKCVRKDFDYAFSVDKYRGVPEIERQKQEKDKLKIRMSAKRQEIEKTRRLIRGLYENFVQGILTNDEYFELKADYEHAINALSGEIEVFEKSMDSLDNQLARYRARRTASVGYSILGRGQADDSFG